MIESAEPVRSLREWRAERLLTIRELARAAGVASSTIYLTETRRTTPRPAVMRRIASVLEVDAQQVGEFRRAIDAHGRSLLNQGYGETCGRSTDGYVDPTMASV